MKASIKPKFLLTQIILLIIFGLIMTVLFRWISPLNVLLIIVIILFIFVTLKRPEIGLLGILIVTSSIIFEDELPRIDVGPITLLISDIMLLGLLGLIVVRSLVEPRFKIVRTPLDWPFFIFIGLMLFSTLTAIFNKSLEYENAINWIRVMFYYLTFFIVTNLVRERRQINFLLNGFFLLATAVSAAVIAQFLLGDSITIISGLVHDLSAEGTSLLNIFRIAPPGMSVVLVAFFTLICILILKKSRSIILPELLSIGLMGISLLLTFLRSLWAAIIMVISLLMVIVRGKDRRRMFRWALIVFSLATVILLLIFINPDTRAARLVSAFVDRYSTLTRSGTFKGQDSSLNYRMLENKYALSSISAHPLIGIGMGARYRPFDRRLDSTDDVYDFRIHIHNGFLWILLDMGVIGFLVFMWISIAFLSRGFRNWRSIANDRLRGIVLGFTSVYLAILIAAVANSSFTQWRWTPVIGIMMGVNEVILKGCGQEDSAN